MESTANRWTPAFSNLNTGRQAPAPPPPPESPPSPDAEPLFGTWEEFYDKGTEAMNAGRFDDARAALEAAHRVAAGIGGPPAALISVLDAQGFLEKRLERYAAALPYYTEALALLEKHHGPDHELTIRMCNNLAGVYKGLERYAEAEPLFLRAIEGGNRLFGSDHPEMIVFHHNLAVMYAMAGRARDAERVFHEAIRVIEAARRDDLWDQWTRGKLGVLLHDQDRFDDARPHLEACLAALEALGKAGDAHWIEIAQCLWNALRKTDRPAEAEALLGRIASLRAKPKSRPTTWTR